MVGHGLCASSWRQIKGGFATSAGQTKRDGQIRLLKLLSITVLVADRGVLCSLDIALDILIQQQPISCEHVSRSGNPIHIISMARIALLERGPRVSIGSAFHFGSGKIDLLTETIATVSPPSGMARRFQPV